MSHPEQMAFFQACADANASALHGARVLEIGSYDVNGSIRRVFNEAQEYVGVDLVEGPGVDVVSFGHELDLGDGTFDISVSAECFEHDPHWPQTFASMIRHTRPGGLVLFTCASRGRVEHGTARSGSTQSPGTEHLGSSYYRNVRQEDFDPLRAHHNFAHSEVWYLPKSADLYFAGIKAGAESRFQMPDRDRIRAIRDLMPPREQLLRYPLFLLARTGISERMFQTLAIPYWQLVVRAVGGLGRVRVMFSRSNSHLT